MADAVFISYASEDVEAAERVALALKEAGVEVWFDKSELRGGDAWDQNIRKRIHDCALFLPVISATTERRHEGYFRLEWRLADRRTHHMGRSRAFLVPVCIDPVDEDQADVPDSFWEVQWVSAPGGNTPPGFASTIKGLLDGGVEGPRVSGSVSPRGEGTEGRSKRERHQWTATEFRWILGLVALVALLAVGVANLKEIRAALGFEEAAVVLEKSIAVLPFRDLSDNAAGTNFADGVQEEILTKLANVRELRVVSRTTVAQYRRTQKSIPEIGSELGVNYILEGTVQRIENQVRLTAKLYEAKSERQLPPPIDLTVNITDLFQAQGDVATSVANALEAALSQQEKDLIGKAATENLSANEGYASVLRAFSQDRPTRAWLQVQEETLRTAVRMDERFSAAWGQLAVVHSLYVELGYDATEARLAAAKAAIERAREIAPESPEVIRSLGIYYYAALRDYPKAIEQFTKLARMQPNSADAPGYLGAVQRHQGKWPEALANLRKATTVDLGNVVHTRMLENVLIESRNYPSAIQNRLRLLQVLGKDLEANFRLALLELKGNGSTTSGDQFVAELGEEKETPLGLEYRVRWARAKGELDEAIRIDKLQARAALDGSPDWVEAIEAAVTLAAKGDRAAARARLDGVEQQLRVRSIEDEDNGSLQSSLGLARALLGNKEDAMEAGLNAVELAKLADGGVDNVADVAARLSLVLIRAWTDDKATAIAELGKLLKAPGLDVTVFSMKRDPWFAPLRGEAGFEALLADPANSQPLFPDIGGRGPGGRGGPGGPGGGPGGLGGRGGGGGGPGGPGGGRGGNRGQLPEGGVPRGGG